MRPIAFVVVALILTSGTSARAAPTLIWETKGLAQPESVVLDASSGALYVSNIAGDVMKKDGTGFISKIDLDGTMVEREWIKGLDAPTGLALHGGKLYVADIDQLVEIDVASAKVAKRYPAPQAIFLNDVVAGPDGTVYAADTPTNTIWRLKDGRFEPWLKNDALNGPNGLVVQGDKLIVASFGKLPSDRQKQELGGLVTVSIKEKTVSKFGKGQLVGNLDGLEPLADGSFLVTDWSAGALYRIGADGDPQRLLDLNQGSADLTYLPDKKMVLIPMMLDNSLVAYTLD